MDGKRVALKDNICLAGVPMMNGASTLEGYVPDVDATVVTRILDAGGTIVGKAHCEYFCLSGGSHTSAHGPVHNPRKFGYSAGGSSSARGALVATGEVDMAIGGDQGGSIRMPSCWSGMLRHEADPRPGALYRRHADRGDLDHTGPMTRHVADNALLLEVIAGPTGSTRASQRARRTITSPRSARRRRAAHRRGQAKASAIPKASPMSTRRCAKAAERCREAWRDGENVSVPMHLRRPRHLDADRARRPAAQMMHGNGMGFNWEGLYTTSLLDAPRQLARARQRSVAHAEALHADRRTSSGTIAATSTPRRRTSRACCAKPMTMRCRATTCC